METRNYYIPYSPHSKLILNGIVSRIPCCIPRIEIKGYNTIKFTITCHRNHFEMVEEILRRESWLED
jgi:hypothetical protein